MIQTWQLYYLFSVFFSNVKLSKLNYWAQVALLNSAFFKKNDDFYLKPKRNFRIAQAWDQAELSPWSQATLCNTIWWAVPLWKIGLRGHGGQIVWPHLQMFHLICHYQPHPQRPPNGLVWAKADLIHWPSIVTKLAFLRPLRTSVRPLRPQLWTKKKLKRW